MADIADAAPRRTEARFFLIDVLLEELEVLASRSSAFGP
jgi:hypothetical protein